VDVIKGRLMRVVAEVKNNGKNEISNDKESIKTTFH